MAKQPAAGQNKPRTYTRAPVDAERLLQVTNMDPTIRHAMRVESVTRGITYAELLFDMWQAYARERDARPIKVAGNKR